MDCLKWGAKEVIIRIQMHHRKEQPGTWSFLCFDAEQTLNPYKSLWVRRWAEAGAGAGWIPGGPFQLYNSMKFKYRSSLS